MESTLEVRGAAWHRVRHRPWPKSISSFVSRRLRRHLMLKRWGHQPFRSNQGPRHVSRVQIRPHRARFPRLLAASGLRDTSPFSPRKASAYWRLRRTRSGCRRLYKPPNYAECKGFSSDLSFLGRRQRRPETCLPRQLLRQLLGPRVAAIDRGRVERQEDRDHLGAQLEAVGPRFAARKSSKLAPRSRLTPRIQKMMASF